MTFPLVADLAEVDWIREQAVKRSAREWLPAPVVALLRYFDARNNPVLCNVLLEAPDAAEFEIAFKNMPYGPGFVVINNQVKTSGFRRL